MHGRCVRWRNIPISLIDPDGQFPVSVIAFDSQGPPVIILGAVLLQGHRRIRNSRESGEHTSEKGSSRGSRFLDGLSMKMALVIEKPNEKSKAKHRQNKPNFYRVEIS